MQDFSRKYRQMYCCQNYVDEYIDRNHIYICMYIHMYIYACSKIGKCLNFNAKVGLITIGILCSLIDL